ncbi:MAG: helix-turn-helix transcriptional regulator [Chloroflexota bacterium]
MNKVPLRQFRFLKNNSIPIEVKRIEELHEIATRPIPHRHTFYVVFWVTEGSGMHYLDFAGDEIQPNSIHFVGPGQIHYWDIENEMKGFVILFESDLFLEKSDQQLLEQLDFFHAINGVSVLYPAPPDIAWFQKVNEQLEIEFQQANFGRTQAVESWLRLLLISAQRLVVDHSAGRGDIPADKQLANRYIQLVEQNAIAHPKVNWYADKLAVTVGHLSKSVKNALGMTAGCLLRDRIVLEAKRLLVHTDNTAAEIALQLNFEDASYFGRFFKRETGQTPNQFRNSFPTKYQNQTTE